MKIGRRHEPNAKKQSGAFEWSENILELLLVLGSLAAVVGLNLLISTFPSAVIQYDTTPVGLYTLSGNTKELVNGLEMPVNIYWIGVSGFENKRTELILKRYAEINPALTVSKIDPAYHPGFIQTHTGETGLTYNSLIVESGEKVQVIKYADYNTANGFLLEEYLNGAIRFVTTQDNQAIYCLTGHGEAALSEALSSDVNLNGYETRYFSLLAEQAVPEAASILLIAAPQTDISEEEAEKIISYLDRGGRMLLITGFSLTQTPNLDNVMGHYGAGRVEGCVLEGDARQYYNSPTYLIPAIESHRETALIINGVSQVLAPVAHGIAVQEQHRSSLELYPVLKTTEYSYAKRDVSSLDISFAPGDVEGPHIVGLAVKESMADRESRVVWYSSAQLLDEQTNEAVSGSNRTLMLNSINWLSGAETVSLNAKGSLTSSLSIMSYTLALWSAVLLAVLPLSVLITGGAVCYFRRRRR